MLKLELDWIGDEEPVGGDGVTVERVAEVGPAGWPVINVFAQGSTGAEAGPRLWAWLVEVYGADEDVASDLASEAESV